MNKLVIFLSIFALIAIIYPVIDNITGSAVMDYNFTCPDGVRISYFYSPDCHACQTTTPLIDSLISNGCPITKINIEEEYELALSNDIHYTPTLIVNDERLIGGFTFSEVKDLIISQE